MNLIENLKKKVYALYVFKSCIMCLSYLHIEERNCSALKIEAEQTQRLEGFQGQTVIQSDHPTNGQRKMRILVRAELTHVPEWDVQNLIASFICEINASKS